LDNGFPTSVEPWLWQVVQQQPDRMVLRQPDPADQPLALCIDAFGLEPGQEIPLFGGLNEFLSALVAVRCLRPYLGCQDLMAVIACIEATVPFRGADAQGRGPSERLQLRLAAHAQRWSMALPADALKRMVLDAVELANRDVSSFAEHDPSHFLSNTWLLMEESNAPLSAVGVYTLHDYRGALSRMEKFLVNLQAEHVFHAHGGVPSAQEIVDLEEAARRNLAFSGFYLGAKLISAGVVEAMAELTGGNAPVSMFLGDISSPQGRPDRAEDHLPSPEPRADLDPDMLAVLEKGRKQISHTDMIASPVTAFVYRTLGHGGCISAMAQAKRYFNGDIGAADFLAELQRPMVHAIIQACAHIALSRRGPLLALAQRYA
jgi:hypothetical protein